MIEIRYMQVCDKAFWYTLDRHLPNSEFELKVRDKRGYVLLNNGMPIGILRYNLLWLNEKLAGFGQKVCFMAYYFLPDVNKLKRLDCPYEIKLLHPEDFENLYTKEWSNALCKGRKELDVLACGAYDGDKN